MTGKVIAPAKSAYHYPLLIKQLWHAPLLQAADQEIVYRDLRRFTYRELRRRVGRLASALAGIGIGPGDTVGILDWDSNRFLEAFFAVPMMGAVLQTVNVRLSPEQIAYTIDHAGSSVLLVNTDFLPLLRDLMPRLPKVKKLVAMSDRPVPLPTRSLPFAGEYEALLAAASPDYPFPDFDENTQATTFYTSGTTGLPKGVYYSHRQVVLHCLAELAFLGLAGKQGQFSRDDVYMPMTPMFHVHAWGFPWAATLAGLKQVYPGRYDPALLVNLIKTEGVTITHGVPTLLEMLLKAADAARINLGGLKMVVGGSELHETLAKRALAAGIDVYAGFGMSETGPIVAAAQVMTKDLGDPERELDVRVRAGITAPLVEARIVGQDMQDLPHDGKTAGELLVRSPWLTQGYVDNPEPSEALWAGGYLHTGDIAVITPDGYIQVTDRMKDVIKSGGEWISSLQIEELIGRYPGVKEAAVIGIPDEKWGERPLAFVVAEADHVGRLHEADIKSHLGTFATGGVISKYGIPEKIEFVEHLAKTSVGKIDKKILRQKYGQSSAQR